MSQATLRTPSTDSRESTIPAASAIASPLACQSACQSVGQSAGGFWRTATGPRRGRCSWLLTTAAAAAFGVSALVGASAPAASDTLPTGADRAELEERFGISGIEFDTVMRIIDEGQNRNQVMVHLTELCEGIGPRLTGSTRVLQANEWAAAKFTEFGLENVHQHEWGTIPVGFDRGPSTGRMTRPIQREFEFTARAWSAGTVGPVSGRVIREPRTQEEFDAVAEELDGAWILRPAVGGRRRGVVGGIDPPGEFLEALREANIAGLITSSANELVQTGAVRGWRDLTIDTLPEHVSVTIRRSDYDAINSRLFDGETVEVEFDLDHTFVEGPIPNFNTIGDIRGSTWPDEIVIVSGHIDSWDGPGSQGTVDNGTGTSVTIEAARILAAAIDGNPDARPKRTIRFILWTGEEQGLLGSRAYVNELSEEDRARISAVFVDDSGTNHQTGVTAIESMVPMLEWAFEPSNYAFPEKQLQPNVAERMPRRGASDHQPFINVGIPGYFWSKTGRANYRYAWHTQNDRMDQAVPEYLLFNSTVSALTAYMVANAETLMPRELPEEEEEAAPVAEPEAAADDDRPQTGRGLRQPRRGGGGAQ